MWKRYFKCDLRWCTVMCGILGGDLQLTTAIYGTVGLFCACAEICLYIAVGDDLCHGLCRSAVFRQTVSLCRGHWVLVVDAGCTGLDRAWGRWQWDRLPSCRTSCRSCWRCHTTNLCQQQTLPVQGGPITAVHFACHVTHFKYWVRNHISGTTKAIESSNFAHRNTGNTALLIWNYTSGHYALAWQNHPQTGVDRVMWPVFTARRTVVHSAVLPQ